MFKSLKKLLALALVAGATTAMADEDPVRTCVFDVIGANGDYFNMMRDYAQELRGIGIHLNLRPYTDENVAVGDFNSGQCDVLMATDLRVRNFNQFTGSISAVGAIPTYENLETVLATLAQPRAAELMKDNGYEVVGIFPAGAGYLFVNDRTMNKASDLAGRRMATLSYQRDAIHMVNFVNATVVPADITNFAGMFNNGSVDTAYAPAFAYEALELYRGIGDTGGIINYPLAQLTFQAVAREGVFDDETAQKARELAWDMYDQAMRVVHTHEDGIPEEHWVEIPADDIEDYQEMFRENRLQLRDGSNGASKVYHPRMLRLLSQVRCADDPTSAECTADDRE